MNRVPCSNPAAQRLLVKDVNACTILLVLSLQNGQRPASIRRLMGERQRLLAELARDVNTSEGVGALTALAAAVAESDRTLEALLC
jgi:hypothetical protein